MLEIAALPVFFVSRIVSAACPCVGGGRALLASLMPVMCRPRVDTFLHRRDVIYLYLLEVKA